MTNRIKYQVFISSTYRDLIEERQSVVKAVLKTRNIPAGMELFAAGDKSQLEIIKNWIAESDIYMLLLGGRYGTLEPDSQLSYTEIEYRYALELKKPMFALVINEDGLKRQIALKGESVLEAANPDKYLKFKEFVMTKMCSFFADEKEIETETLASLYEIRTNNELTLCGWIRNYPYLAPNYGVEITSPKNGQSVESYFTIKGRYKIFPRNITYYIVEYNPQLDNYWPKNRIVIKENTKEWSLVAFIGNGDDKERIIHIVAAGPYGTSVIEEYFHNSNINGFGKLSEDMIIVDTKRIILKKIPVT